MGSKPTCQYRGCRLMIDPADKWGREFGLCPMHARQAEQTLGIKPTINLKGRK